MVQLIVKAIGVKNWFVPIMVGSMDMAKEKQGSYLWNKAIKNLREEKNLCLEFKDKKIEEDLNDYLTGLFEGDGGIWIQEDKAKGKRHNPRFVITFNRKDILLCKKLLEILGNGRIGYNKGNNACDLVISKVVGLKKVVGMINGRMRTPKIGKMNNLIDWLNKHHNAYIERSKILRGEMGKDNWLGGFIDADGSFGVRYNEGNGNGKRRVRCDMSIEQRMEDPKTKESYKEVMEEIAEYLGVNLRIRDQKLTGRKYYKLVGSSKRSRKILKDYFERYRLYTSKYMDYKDWEKVANLIENGEQYSDEGLKIVKEVKGRMNRNRKVYDWDHLKYLKFY